MCKRIFIYLVGATIIFSGCSSGQNSNIQYVNTESKSATKEDSTNPIEIESQSDLDYAEKFKRVVEVQADSQLDSTETINLYGFDIPIYLIRTDYNYDTSKKDDTYPYIDWFEGWTSIAIPLNIYYPEGGGETYKLKNFLELKYDENTVNDIMERFKKGEDFSMNFDDKTFMRISTGTDDTRFVYIGYISDDTQ